jgi:hypothetical protein
MPRKKLKLDLRKAYEPIEVVLSKKPLVGYRAWSLGYFYEDGEIEPYLHSISTCFVWTSPIVRNNKEPIIKHTTQLFNLDRNLIGFFAVKDKPKSSRVIGVIGKVSMFGKVIEHTKGYRAQNMRVDALQVNETITNKMNFRLAAPCSFTPYETIPGGDILFKVELSILEHGKKNVYTIKRITMTREEIIDKLSRRYDCPVIYKGPAGA